jgi:hypothetical protein
MNSMDGNSILNAFVQALRGKREILKREMATLNAQQVELTARQRDIADQLSKKSAEHEAITPEKINSYVADWHLRGRHSLIPCPICYCLGRNSELIALASTDKMEHLKCKTCREEFQIVVD